MQRGEIWWAALPEPTGSEPGYRRPVVVIQSNSFNESRINTIICVVLTSNTRLAAAPGNVLLSTRATGLSRESVANISQLITVDRAFFSEFVAQLPSKKMQQIEQGIRLVLSL